MALLVRLSISNIEMTSHHRTRIFCIAYGCIWMTIMAHPSFLTQNRKKWIPIYAQTHMELFNKRDDWVEESRTMIPMILAWAWNIHKSQGQTIRTNIFLTLDNKDMAHGLPYVAVSRATLVSNIGIRGGLTFTRIS